MTPVYESGEFIVARRPQQTQNKKNYIVTCEINIYQCRYVFQNSRIPGRRVAHFSRFPLILCTYHTCPHSFALAKRPLGHNESIKCSNMTSVVWGSKKIINTSIFIPCKSDASGLNICTFLHNKLVLFFLKLNPIRSTFETFWHQMARIFPQQYQEQISHSFAFSFFTPDPI